MFYLNEDAATPGLVGCASLENWRVYVHAHGSALADLYQCSSVRVLPTRLLIILIFGSTQY